MCIRDRLKGGASTLYGSSAAAAVINITTHKVTKKNQFNLSVNTGTEQSQNESLNEINYFSNHFQYAGKAKDIFYKVGYSGLKTDGMSAVESGTEKDPFARYNINAQLGANHNQLSWYVQASKAKIENDYDNVFPIEDANFTAVSTFENITANIKYTYAKGELSVDFYDATSLVNWQRSIKSETEIIYMKRAAKIVQHMHEIILEKARVGLPKNELIAEVYHASVMGVDGFWGDYPSMVPMAPSGMDATAPHLTWDDKPLVEGETTFFEIAGAYKRYQCPQSRTLFLGKPSQKYLDAEKAVLEGIEVGLEMAKPGNQCQDIARAFNTTLNKLGFEKDSRCGYAIGVSYPPDWGERTMLSLIHI